MLTAIVLICSLNVTPELRECTRDNATNVVQVPEEFGNPATCMLHGEAFIAGTTVGQNLASDERVKVMCVRHQALNRRVG
jgi:hypothetical protein